MAGQIYAIIQIQDWLHFIIDWDWKAFFDNYCR